MSLIDDVLKQAKEDKNFRGSQIIAYMVGYIEGYNSSPEENVKKVNELIKLIREINIYDSERF